MIFIMRLKECMDSVEGEAVARQTNRNREWTQIAANFWERDREWTRMDSNSDQSRLAALPMYRMAEHSRLFASIRGFILDFWKFQKQLMQVVDFQDSFSYFWIFLMVLVASIRGSTPVLESSKSPYASR
jgi:hypothetical protein